VRVLLVEDDPMIGDAVERGLCGDVYAVDRARDAGEADTALRAQPRDLVLLDLGLPRGDGLALLRAVRARGEPLLRAGAVCLDPATHRVTVDGASVALSAREYALLRALMDRPRGRAVARAARGEALRLERADRQQRGRGAPARAAAQARGRRRAQRPRRRLDDGGRVVSSLRRRLLAWTGAGPALGLVH
jgi:DNA-binding response OmpR family regulator